MAQFIIGLVLWILGNVLMGISLFSSHNDTMLLVGYTMEIVGCTLTIYAIIMELIS